jgi:hypothetical protein
MANRLQRIFVYSLVSSVCSIVIGAVFYQESVFLRTHYAFQFVTSGILGSVFLSMLRFANAKDATATLLGLFVCQFLVTRPSGMWFIFRDVAFVAALGSSLYLFFVSYFKKGRGEGLLTPVLIGALLGACNLLASVVLILVGGRSLTENVPVMLVNVILGMLIGIGIGTGVLLSDRIAGTKIAVSGNEQS